MMRAAGDTTIAHNESLCATSMATGIREFRPVIDKWCHWQEVLDSHFVEAAVDEDRIKTSTLLKAVGLEAYGLLRELCFPDLPAKKKYKELCDMLKMHYSPPVIIFRERRNFLDAKKREEESVAAWYARLKKLAMECKYGQQLEQFVLNKFVTGLEGRIFEKLCEEDEGLNLEGALRKALTMEAKLYAQRGESEGVNYVQKRYAKTKKNNNNNSNKGNGNKVNGYENNGNQAKKKCSHCGWKNHASEKCKYKSSVCHKCRKVGHLASVCNNNHVNVVQVSNENLNDDNDNYSETLNDCNFSIYSVTGELSAAPFTLEIELNNKMMDFVLDTGAACSLMSSETFYNYFKEVGLHPSTKKLCAYGGEGIKVMGEFLAMVRFRGQVKNLSFVVTNARSPPILGRDFMSMFGVGISNVNSIMDMNEGVQSIKKRFSKVFNKDLGLYTGGTVTLNLIEKVKPVFCKPRPVPLAWRAKIESQLQDLVEKGVLVHVDNSEWGTPLVPILKPNGQIRICGDYKSTINKYLEDVKYPLPLIDELFASLRGELFTKLDLSNAYNQLMLDESSQLLCAWSTHLGIFKMTRLPFGVKPAAAIFQKTIENILRGISNVVNYLDDIIITGRNLEDHVKTIELVLSKLESVGLRLNSEKCEFFKHKVSYLGFNINRDGLSLNKDRISSVLDAPVPKNVSEVRAFVGMLNYYSKFIPNFAHKMAPLYELLRKEVEFKWTKTRQSAFEALKEEVTSDKILVHFNPRLPILLSTDASNFAVAGILAHIGADGSKKPIAFVSRALSQTERNYSTIQKEALAIVFSVTKLKQYLLGIHFTLESDHKPLLAIFGENKGLPVMAAARIQRWAFILSGFNYTMRFVKGIENSADHLSRFPHRDREEDSEDFGFINYIGSDNKLNLNFRDISRETRRDPILAKLKEAIQVGKIGLLKGDEFIPFVSREKELSVEYECILWGFRVVIPQKLRNKILAQLHYSHFGIVKTKALARSYMWWPKIDHDIEKLVSNCVSCKVNQPSPEKAPLIPWVPTDTPWSRLHIDFAGPIKDFHFLLIIDSYSKWVEVFKTKNITSSFTISKLREVFGRFGLIDTLVSDNGRQFTAEEFKVFMKSNNIKHILTAPGHPATNGQAENLVKTFKKTVLANLRDGENLDDIISLFLFDYRTTKHCSTGETPAKLLLGREIKTRFSMLCPPLVRNKIVESQLSNIKNHRGARNINFENDKKVFVRDYSNPNKASWQEATVKKRLGPQSYHCILTRNNKSIKRHVNQMIRGTQSASENADIDEQTGPEVSNNKNEPESEKSVSENDRGQQNVTPDTKEIKTRNLRRLQRPNYKE